MYLLVFRVRFVLKYNFKLSAYAYTSNVLLQIESIRWLHNQHVLIPWSVMMQNFNNTICHLLWRFLCLHVFIVWPTNLMLTDMPQLLFVQSLFGFWISRHIYLPWGTENLSLSCCVRCSYLLWHLWPRLCLCQVSFYKVLFFLFSFECVVCLFGFCKCVNVSLYQSCQLSVCRFSCVSMLGSIDNAHVSTHMLHRNDKFWHSYFALEGFGYLKGTRLICNDSIVCFYFSTWFDLKTFGWTPQEAKLHMVADYFSESEVSWLFCVFFLFPLCL